MSKTTLLIALFLLVGTTVYAQDATEEVTTVTEAPDPAQLRWEVVAENLVNPLYVTSAGDDSGRMFVLEQPGRIWIVADGQKLDTPFLDITNLASQDILGSYSERGLLGLAFHPDFETNGEFFVHYSDTSGDTVVAQYTVSADDPNVADASSAEILMTHPQPYSNHNGGQIAFGPDGYLYIGLGDGGSQGDPENRAQDPDVLLGKILRIDVDGEEPYGIPADNPANTTNPELAPEVWALGLRNPWRFSFDRVTGDLYIADVGQNQWEEVNFQPAGAGALNYGWRPYEANQPYSGETPPADMVLPIAEYDHSLGCSISGGYVYRGEALPQLQGVYLFGDWCSGRLWASYRDASETWQTTQLMETGRTISSFGEDDAGELYLLDYYGGALLKLVPAS